VLVAEQVQAIGLEHYGIEELAAHAVAQQPCAVLGERAVVEAGLDHIHIQKPAEQQMVSQFLAEGPLTANRVQTDQQAGFEKPLGRNRGTSLAIRGVRLIEQRRQLP
jgi:hypothetical protein